MTARMPKRSAPDPEACPPEAAEYFARYAEGRYCDFAHVGYIYPREQATLSADGAVLNIGRPGVDGLEFSYRRGHPGIWVWYPLDGEWRQIAPDIDTLDRAWRDRTLSV